MFTSCKKILILLLTLIVHSYLVHIFPCFAIEERPELESQFKGCIREAVKYACTINDFDELVDLRILPRHCLGSKPSHYVLHAIYGEEKSESFQDKTSPSSFLFFFFFFYILTFCSSL